MRGGNPPLPLFSRLLSETVCGMALRSRAYPHLCLGTDQCTKPPSVAGRSLILMSLRLTGQDTDFTSKSCLGGQNSPLTPKQRQLPQA